MQIKLLSIAALAAFTLGVTGAQAQSTTPSASKDHKPSVDRKAKKAEDERIEANYKADKAKCKDMKGNEKEVCEADAKGKEKIAKAELEQKYDPSPAHERKVAEAKAEHEYNVQKEKCDAQKGKQENACEKEAKAKYERAKADIKAKQASGERKAGAGGTSQAGK